MGDPFTLRPRNGFTLASLRRWIIKCAQSVEVAEIVPSLKAPLGINVFERVETCVLFLEPFSTAKRNAKDKLEEAHEKTAVCHDNDGLVRMTICDRREHSDTSVQALLTTPMASANKTWEILNSVSIMNFATAYD